MSVEISTGVRAAQTANTGTILFYDGTCAFCSKNAQFVFKHEGARRTLRFGTLQGATAAALRARHPVIATIDSIVWYEPARANRPERLLFRSSAALATMAYLGGGWRFLAGVLWLIPRPIRDALYDGTAKRRHQLAKNEACLLPTPEQQPRFVD